MLRCTVLACLLVCGSLHADEGPWFLVRVRAEASPVACLALSAASAAGTEGGLSVRLAGAGGETPVLTQVERRADGGWDLAWLRVNPGQAETYAVRVGTAVAGPAGGPRLTVAEGAEGVTVDTGAAAVRHDPQKAGLPGAFRCPGGAEQPLRWADRVYAPDVGAFDLGGDPEAQVRVLSRGPLRATVEVRARYRQGGAMAPGEPGATYRFTYTAGSALVGLEMTVSLPGERVWPEVHLAELSGIRFGGFLRDAAGTALALTGRNEPVYAEEALVGTGPDGVLGLAQDPGEMQTGDDRLAFWDPAAARDAEESARQVPTYVRGPWWAGVRGERSHRLTLVLGPPGMAEEAIREQVAGVVTPAQPRVRCRALDEMRAVAARSGAGTGGPAGWWWAAFRRGVVERACQRAQALADAGGLAEAAEAARGVAALAARLGRGLPATVAGSTADCWAGKVGEWVCVGSGRCAAAMTAGGTPAVSSLVRRGGDDMVRAEAAVPLLRARLRRPDGTELETAAAGLRVLWSKVSCDPGGAVMALGVGQEAEPGVELQGTLRCAVAAGGDETRWTAEVSVEGASLLWVRFPDVSVAPVGGLDALVQQVAITPRTLAGNVLARPFGNRRLGERDPFGDMWDAGTMMYPHLSMPLQMTCLYRQGGGRGADGLLYLATDDPEANWKAFQYVGERDARLGPALRAAFIHVPEGPGTAREYQTPYATVLAPLAGDWYDAAARYREWAAGRPWCGKGKVAAREDQPRWIQTVPVWFLASNCEDAHVQALSDCADLVGVPVAAHWYDWHHNRFDSRMPEYFPPARGEEAFRAHIAQWHEHNIRSVPYIQGVLWDMLTPSWEREGAAAAAVRGPDGSIPFWTSFGGTPDEAHCATMCVATDFWQEKLLGYVQRLADSGVDGVYLDSAGCGAGPCYATDHGHPAGPGGHWWADSVRRLMERLGQVRTRSGERLIFTTEAFTEPGIGAFDSYLPHLHHPRPEEPCVYDAVYHEYTSFHGCYTGGGYQPDGTLSRAAATCLALGRPLGWFYHGFHNDQYLTPAAAAEMAFVRELALARQGLGRFLATGRMLRPPVVRLQGTDAGGEAPVLASVWEDGDEALVVAVNYSDAPVRFRLELRGVTGALARAWPPAREDAVRLDARGSTPALVLDGRSVAAWRCQVAAE